VSGLHVEVVGSGPPLVLLHGWAMHGGVLAPLVERLSAHRTLHVVDLPGHGLSRDSTVPLQLETCARALLDAVPVAPWCGWSLGGMQALQAAALVPQRVPALVMLCATPKFVRSADWAHGMPGETFRKFAEGLRNDWRVTLERFIAMQVLGSDHAREELRSLQRTLSDRGVPAMRGLADGLALLEDTDLRAVLPTLTVPSLWMAGSGDRLVDPLAMQAAAALAPRARYVRIEHVGHAPFLTRAAYVVDPLLGFLDEVHA